MQGFSRASKRMNLLPRHKGMSKAAPQTVSVLVAKRSKSPGYPLWVALDTPNAVMKTNVNNPVIIEKASSPENSGLSKNASR